MKRTANRLKESEGPTTRYASEAMEARRARILQTARDLLATDTGRFTMRDLARESDVALATLYNIFGSQDELIAEAIAEVFVERIQNLVPANTTDPIETMLERLKLSHAEIMRVPAYAKKMLGIYFSSETNSAIREILHSYPRDQDRSVLEALLNEGALHEWVDIATLADDLTVTQYGVLTHWANGDVAEDKLLTRMHYASLSLLVGCLKEAWAAPVRLRLESIARGLRLNRPS